MTPRIILNFVLNYVKFHYFRKKKILPGELYELPGIGTG